MTPQHLLREIAYILQSYEEETPGAVVGCTLSLAGAADGEVVAWDGRGWEPYNTQMLVASRREPEDDEHSRI